MEDITSSSKTKGPYITILVIAIGALVSTSVVLALLHIMFVKFCKRRRLSMETLLIEPSTIGLDKRILNTIPILFYSSKTCELHGINQGDQFVICLGHLHKGDSIRWLPICGHVFHVPCVDNWFNLHSNCPICRSPVSLFPLMAKKTTPNRNQLVPICNQDTGASDRDNDNDNARRCISRTRSGSLLCHCNRMVFPVDGLRPRDLIKAGLQRSLSMDQSSVVVDITDEQNTEGASSPNYSSYNSYPPLSKIDFVLSRLYQGPSIRHLENMYSMAPRWLHGLRSGPGGDMRNNRILPY